MKCELNWKEIKKERPTTGIILIYCPSYSIDDTMRYRVIDSSFLNVCTDATHWCKLTSPENEL